MTPVNYGSRSAPLSRRRGEMMPADPTRCCSARHDLGSHEIREAGREGGKRYAAGKFKRAVRIAKSFSRARRLMMEDSGFVPSVGAI
ncbi:hypothetical protein E2C01_078790 [Portunus trituberculatus]|uniref:Uncharacterized protein n=1 Tax=Portunus trituberculatus TaxID=210409 RepID=A0A5B7IV23_PORTR|nr:hypothetical protein [Portunus trituberculatus]